MKKLITAQEFERTFRSQWEEDRCAPKYEKRIKTVTFNRKTWYNNDKKWTLFMLGERKKENKKVFFYEGDTEAFFYRVLQKLKRKDIRFFRELERPITDQKSLPPELKEQYSNKDHYEFDGVYGNDNPLCVDVLIEHENSYDRIKEDEMWKLLVFKSPLKVLVSYDIPKNKLCKLACLAKQVNESCKEVEETEYLIVIGTRDSPDNIIWEFKKLNQSYQWVNNS